MKLKTVTIFFLMAWASALQAQNSEPASPVNERLLKALSLPDYKVGPGDVFELRYQLDDTPLERFLQLDSTLKVNLGILGTIDAKGLKLVEFKNVVENQVRRTYPLSSPVVVFVNPGYFSVKLVGKVQVPGNNTVWGGIRVSELLAKEGSAEAGRRFVTLRRGDTDQLLDLYRGKWLADPLHDPLLEEGDTITVSVAARVITVEGAVTRPGSYELAEGEGFTELIDQWVGGILNSADLNSATLSYWENGDQRKVEPWSPSADKDRTYKKGDFIFIPDIRDRLPKVTLEGAFRKIYEAPASSGAEKTTDYYTETMVLSKGETAMGLLRTRWNYLLPNADLERAVVIRAGKTFPLNLKSLQESRSSGPSMNLMDGDRLIVPTKRTTVLVTGAVTAPGEYEFIPDRTWEYYVSKAGGYNETLTWGGGIRITDSFGRFKEKNTPVEPDDQIYVPTSGLSTFLKEAGPLVAVISSLAAIVVSGISIYHTVTQ